MKKNKPNILWICTDEQRYDSLGCTGNPHAVTPHLDALASEGALYSRFITANPVCMPSRASFFTGQMPSRHGVVTNGIPLPNRDMVAHAPERADLGPLESHATTLPELLARGGYHTRSIGKLHLTPTQASPDERHPENHWLWHEGKMEDWHGPYYGFEHVDLTLHHGERNVFGHYRQWLKEVAPEVDKALSEPNAQKTGVPNLYPGRIPPQFHHSTWVGDRAVTFLMSEEAKQSPFFLWMSFPDPHLPFTPPAELSEEFASHDYLRPGAVAEDLQGKPSAWPKKGVRFFEDRPENIALVRRYTDAQNHLVDRAVGRAVQALKDSGLWDNTVVVFTSDHGDYLGEFGLVGKKELPSNALNHVPCIVRDPTGRLPLSTNLPISGVDLFPTICDLAGIEIEHAIDGQSLLGRRESRNRALVQCQGAKFPASFTIYDERYRLSWYPESDEWECYDHDEDPYEKRNIFNEFRERSHFAELKEELMTAHLKAMRPNIGRASCW